MAAGLDCTRYRPVAMATLFSKHWLMSFPAELGDYNSATCDAGYLTRVELMPRLVSE